MLATRVIARLDVKAPQGVVKGRRMDGLRVVGPPAAVALEAEAAGADEILLLDVVASLYGRGPDLDLIRWTAAWLATPLTVGGGIRTLGDVRAVMRAGADKVAVNTAALARPGLLREIAEAYGRQALVASLEAKRIGPGWTAYTCGGREPSGRPVAEWAAMAVAQGAGEVLLTSVDHDGMGDGPDLALIRAVTAACPDTPLVYSGGIATADHARAALAAGADAVAVASLLHTMGLGRLKVDLADAGVAIRWA
jgi:cyclase